MRSRVGRVALVTGASRGLGAAIAVRLGADGFAVAVNYARSASEAERVIGRTRAAGSAAETFGADVTDEAAVAARGALPPHAGVKSPRASRQSPPPRRRAP